MLPVVFQYHSAVFVLLKIHPHALPGHLCSKIDVVFTLQLGLWQPSLLKIPYSLPAQPTPIKIP